MVVTYVWQNAYLGFKWSCVLFLMNSWYYVHVRVRHELYNRYIFSTHADSIVLYQGHNYGRKDGMQLIINMRAKTTLYCYYVVYKIITIEPQLSGTSIIRLGKDRVEIYACARCGLSIRNIRPASGTQVSG